MGNRAGVEGRKQASFELGRLWCSHQAHRPGPREPHLNPLDDPGGAAGEDIDSVRQVHRLTDVVGDQQNGPAVPFPDRLQPTWTSVRVSE